MFHVSPENISLHPLALLPLSLLMAGCGASLQSASPSDLSTASISGTLIGGRNPISGATVSLYSVGKTGYGSAATQIGSSVTSTSGGGFNFPTGTLSSCATVTPNAPVYLLSVGGNAGSGVNSAAVLGADLGTCGNFAPNLLVNEITTAALAFSMSHFFSFSSGGVTDTFGGPAGTGAYAPYATGIGLAAAHTAPAIVNVANGTPAASTSTFVLDSAKLYSIGNTLAACVNSTGPSSTQCSTLFTNTSYGSVQPADTLQAAVDMALYPWQNVNTLFALGPANGAPYVGLTTAPNDWTIGVAYKSSSFGLELNAHTLTTIDIDSAGKVWFPSNLAGAVGVGNYDPTTGAFYGPYTGSGLTHPQQVAIDNTNSVWVNDNSGPKIFSFSTSNSNPTAPTAYTLANTVSTSVSINDNNAVDVGIQNTSNSGYFLALQAAGTYAQIGTASAPAYIQSIASDGSGSNAISLLTASGPTAAADYVSGTTPTFTSVFSALTDNPGQMLFTGSNYIMPLPQTSSSATRDSVCIFSSSNCFLISSGQALSPYGAAIDGDGSVWLADAANTLNYDSSSNTAYAGAQVVPSLQPGNTSSTPTLGNHPYFHGNGNGATATTPYGIAIDNSGNVWMSNVGCVITAPATSCTPGAFVLTELIGAAAPTLTPVSNAIVGSNGGPGTRP